MRALTWRSKHERTGHSTREVQSSLVKFLFLLSQRDRGQLLKKRRLTMNNFENIEEIVKSLCKYFQFNSIKWVLRQPKFQPIMQRATLSTRKKVNEIPHSFINMEMTYLICKWVTYYTNYIIHKHTSLIEVKLLNSYSYALD